jgi:hypothetical protein
MCDLAGLHFAERVVVECVHVVSGAGPALCVERMEMCMFCEITRFLRLDLVICVRAWSATFRPMGRVTRREIYDGWKEGVHKASSPVSELSFLHTRASLQISKIVYAWKHIGVGLGPRLDLKHCWA